MERELWIVGGLIVVLTAALVWLGQHMVHEEGEEAENRDNYNYFEE